MLETGESLMRTRSAPGLRRDFGLFVSIVLGAECTQCAVLLGYAQWIGFNPDNHIRMGVAAIAFGVAAGACAWNLWRLK